MDTSRELAAAETHLLSLLEGSNPPRDASRYNVTAAARDLHESSGSWRLEDLDHETVEAALARHPATD